MAKKLESSKATAKHIKQHTYNMQGKGTKPQQPPQQKQSNQHQPYDRNPNQCTRCGDSPHAQGFNCPAKKYQCKHC